jgi:hypothetical protein
VSAKRIVEALGGGRRAWLCRCPCPSNPMRGFNLIIMTVPGGITTRCLNPDCAQETLSRDLLHLGCTPLDDERKES